MRCNPAHIPRLALQYGFDLIWEYRCLTFWELVRYRILRRGGDPRILVVIHKQSITKYEQ